MIEVELGRTAFVLVLAGGFLAGAISVWVFRKLTDANEFRVASNRLLAHLFEFRLFADEPLLLLRAQRDLLAANIKLLRQAAIPSLVLLLPFALLMYCGEAFFSKAPLRPGESTVVTAQYPATELISPAGMIVETPPVNIARERELSWRIRPLRPVSGNLKFIAVGAHTIEQRICAEPGLHWLAQPGSTISIQYPDATLFGVSWLVWFFAASLLGSVLAILPGRTVALLACLVVAPFLNAQTVSPLLSRGYTVIPQPQSVKLGTSDFIVNSDWSLRIGTGVDKHSSAYISLTDQLESRYNIHLQSNSSKSIELEIKPGSVIPGPSQDQDHQAIAEQAYRLETHPSSIRITANGESGLFYGVQTLVQLVKTQQGRLYLPEGEIVDWPDLEIRQIYWDDAHHLEKLPVLKQAVRQASFFKINGFVIKLEGHFQFQHAPAVVEPQALSPEQLQDLTDYAARYHVQLIPYLDAPAHLAFLLKHPEYARFREFPESNYELCAVNPEALQLLYGMYDDLLAANKGTKYFYLSTDEAYYVGLASNSQCDEASAAKLVGSRGKLLAQFVTKTATYLRDHGRTVVFWGEYPLKPRDIEALPPFVINGETPGEEFDAVFRAHGIRQMIYQSTEGEERLFPQYFLRPPSHRLHPLQENTQRVESSITQISEDPARRLSDLIGLVVAGWGDMGLRPETFWLGYATVTAAGWHTVPSGTSEALAAFYPLYYGPAVTNMNRMYQLLSFQAQTWTDTWDTVDSTARRPIWGDSNEVFATPKPAKDQVIPLLPIPNDDLQIPGTWSHENSARLNSASDARSENDELLGLLADNLRLATQNRYDLELFVTIARLCRQNLDFVSGFGRIDDALEEAASQAKNGSTDSALESLDRALELARTLKSERDRVFRNTVDTWYETWLPRVAEANGRHYVHSVDDVKDHLPDRTSDMSYLIYRELNLPLDTWYAPHRSCQKSLRHPASFARLCPLLCLEGHVTVKQVLRPPEVRGANRAAVLSLLQRNDYMSRADVARQSGLSEGAISRIMTDLMSDGLVREDGAENSTGGRPGRRLKLNPRRVVFGAEIQNWETRCAVTTMQGRLVETRRFRTPASADETLDSIAAIFLSFRKELGTDRLPGIGICARGIVNCETGVLVLGSRPEWQNVPIRQFLESRLRESVFVENNVRAAALAEYTFEMAELAGRRCFVFVKVDEGVGVGVLFDGKLYHGPHMAAGEFGQMVIELSEGDERHDREGCLERLISNPALCLRYAELSGAKRQSNMQDTSARVRRIVEWAREGDAPARQTLDETARYLGVSISNIVWGLDADTIVIDGAITDAWRLVEPVLRQQLPDNLELWGARNLVVRPSAFGGEAALMGAASLPLQTIFSQGVAK